MFGFRPCQSIFQFLGMATVHNASYSFWFPHPQVNLKMTAYSLHFIVVGAATSLVIQSDL